MHPLYRLSYKVDLISLEELHSAHTVLTKPVPREAWRENSQIPSRRLTKAQKHCFANHKNNFELCKRTHRVHAQKNDILNVMITACLISLFHVVQE